MKRQKLNLKLNYPVSFRTNEALYHAFNRKCKDNKQFTGDRINALIIADLGIDIPTAIFDENPTLFDQTENPIIPEESSSEVA